MNKHFSILKCTLIKFDSCEVIVNCPAKPNANGITLEQKLTFKL